MVQKMILICKKEFGDKLNAKFTLNKKYKFEYENGFEFYTKDDSGEVWYISKNVIFEIWILIKYFIQRGNVMFRYLKEEKFLNNLVNKVKENGSYVLDIYDKRRMDKIRNSLERLKSKGINVNIKERTYQVNSYGNLKTILTKDVALSLQ